MLLLPRQMVMVVDPTSPTSMQYLERAVAAVPDRVPCVVVSSCHSVAAPDALQRLQSMCTDLQVWARSCVNLCALSCLCVAMCASIMGWRPTIDVLAVRRSRRWSSTCERRRQKRLRRRCFSGPPCCPLSGTHTLVLVF